ncbi:MAG: hypothetical protein ACREXR_17305, partial [Gammaproteobacteria bacterium]
MPISHGSFNWAYQQVREEMARSAAGDRSDASRLHMPSFAGKKENHAVGGQLSPVRPPRRAGTLC